MGASIRSVAYSVCVLIVMSKRKASYDLTFKLKAVKCVEEKTKEAAAREFNVDPRRNSETVMEIAWFFLY